MWTQPHVSIKNSLTNAGMEMIGTRFVVLSVALAVAGCGSVPASNPVPDAQEPSIPLLSDLDIPENAPSVTLTAPAEPDRGGFLSGNRSSGTDATRTFGSYLQRQRWQQRNA